MFEVSSNLAFIVGATLCGALLLAALAKAYDLKWLESFIRLLIIGAAAVAAYLLWTRYL